MLTEEDPFWSEKRMTEATANIPKIYREISSTCFYSGVLQGAKAVSMLVSGKLSEKDVDDLVSRAEKAISQGIL